MKTTIILRQLITWLIALVILFGFIGCSEDDEQPEPKTIAEVINNYLDNTQRDGAPGLSISIRQGGQIIYKGNRGLARLSDSTPIGEYTQFRTASVTKPITAIAIMMLVEQNKLVLSDKLLEIVPNLPSSFSEITIEQLLAHRSGLLDYIDDNTDVTNLDGLLTKEIVGLLEGSGLENLQFVPGSSGDYSNTGYVFLALVIEAVSGQTYPEFIKNEIFEPIGMSNSFVISENEQFGDLGNNYALSFGRNVKVFGFNSLIYGANGVVSTTADLTLFVEALLDYEIISEESLSLMTEAKGALVEIADYGLGWMTGRGNYWHSGKFSDINDFWHAGGFDGYRTVLSINPDLDLQVIILTNNGETSQQQMFDILELTRTYLKQ